LRVKFKALRIASLLFAIVFCAGISHAQTALTQTTLTAAVGAGQTPFSGTTTAYTTTIPVASTTGLIASGVPLYIQSIIYIDQEAMAVISFNTTTLQAVVQRGYLSTTVQPHNSGTMVLIGPPGAFNSQDPMGSNGALPGACVAAATAFTPYINVTTGRQWLCSTITNTWVAGWNNDVSPPMATATVASAAGLITPSGPQFAVTGAAAITGFNIPVGFNATTSGGGCFVITSAAGSTWTWTAATNISIAGTGTALKAFSFCWDATSSKFIPSAVA
jgi:hypothetical protein